MCGLVEVCVFDVVECCGDFYFGVLFGEVVDDWVYFVFVGDGFYKGVVDGECFVEDGVFEWGGE